MWNTSIIAEQIYCVFQVQLAEWRGLYAVLFQQHRAAVSLRRQQELGMWMAPDNAQNG